MKWGVVTTSIEPPPLILAFVAYHLELGAERIWVFLDKPQEEVESALACVDQCTVTICDSSYWAAAGGRPRLVTERQKVNAQWVYDQSEVDWLLHIDADEFAIGIEEIEKLMHRGANSVAAIRLPVAERVQLQRAGSSSIFEGVFRIPAGAEHSATLTRIYGEAAHLLNDGVKAYSHFKSLARCGLGLRIGIHGPLALAERPERTLQAPIPSLLHFDGLTSESWSLKMQRKFEIEDLASKPNRARVRQILMAGGATPQKTPLPEFFRQLDTISREQYMALQKNGLIHEEQFDPVPEVRRLFPHLEYEFSQDEYDRYFLARRLR